MQTPGTGPQPTPQGRPAPATPQQQEPGQHPQATTADDAVGSVKVYDSARAAGPKPLRNGMLAALLVILVLVGIAIAAMVL